MNSARIDKWLWSARFYKTRSLASQEIDNGHVQINKSNVKPAKDVRIGDVVTLLQGKVPRTVIVKDISEQRGPASVAQLLYEETAQSLAERSLIAERNRLSPEPALTITKGRPTKRDRRDLQSAWDDGAAAPVDLR